MEYMQFGTSRIWTFIIWLVLSSTLCISGVSNVMAQNLNLGSIVTPTAPNIGLGSIVTPTAPNIGTVNIPQNTLNVAPVAPVAPGSFQAQSNFCNNVNVQTATLTVQKIINSVSNFNGVSFTITVQNGGLTQTFSGLSVLNPLNICIVPGTVSVTEQSVFGATNPTYTFSVGGTTVNTAACNGSVGSGQTAVCSITNTISSSIPPVAPIPPNAGASANTQTGFFTPPLSPQTGTAVNPGVTGATGGTVGTATNPPFQTCASNTANKTLLTNAGTQQVQGAFTTRLPSSATYVMSGSASLNQLRNALNEFHTTNVKIVLKSDLQNDDNVLLRYSGPQFAGDIIVQNNDGTRQKDIPFNVDTVRTECKFITMAQAFNVNGQIAPLGVLGNLKLNQLSVPPIDKELFGGLIVAREAALTALPAVLNPPFATCQTSQTSGGSFTSLVNKPAAFDNIALYIIKGNMVANQLSGHKLTVFLTSDLNNIQFDQAKILKSKGNNANNQKLVANLIANENQNSAKRIGFTLTDVNTDCKQISLFAGKTNIFSPLPGELDP